jgi:hypothetical protein
VDESGGRNRMDIDERIEWEEEKARRRAAWEQQRQAEAERREREEKQARLSDYLRRRTDTWTEHTGTPPPSGMLTRWTEEYVTSTVADQDLDLELRRAQAEDIWS